MRLAPSLFRDDQTDSENQRKLQSKAHTQKGQTRNNGETKKVIQVGELSKETCHEGYQDRVVQVFGN